MRSLTMGPFRHASRRMSFEAFHSSGDFGILPGMSVRVASNPSDVNLEAWLHARNLPAIPCSQIFP
jgi:hypothetical protein